VNPPASATSTSSVTPSREVRIVLDSGQFVMILGGYRGAGLLVQAPLSGFRRHRTPGRFRGWSGRKVVGTKPIVVNATDAEKIHLISRAGHHHAGEERRQNFSLGEISCSQMLDCVLFGRGIPSVRPEEA
jgi:hypothetical protein